MGCDSVQIRGLIRKFPINTIRLLYRSVCDHPFVVCWMCFLVFLYRSFPFLLSLLVSASPVLVCTAVLLGTLLSFGQANIPETEEEVAHEIVPLNAGVSRDANIVVDKDVSFTTKKLTGLRENITKKAKEQASSVETRAHKIENAFDTSVDKYEGNNHVLVLEKKRECHKVKSEIESSGEDQEVEIQYTLVGQERDDDLEVDTDKSPAESVISHRRRRFDSDEDGVGDERSSNHESDNSSPDTSMVDIVPMMDELHPLLDGAAPQPAHMSRDDTDATSERSMGSRDVETNEDSENKGEEVDGDGDDTDEAMPGNKGGVRKSAIFWTEDDHKNVMDLGTSDIERNQRLESLIARRKDWKTVNLTCNVPSITTTRCNPFDDPDYSYNYTGLPPCPVSAPSMLPRRNPFDIPYDLSEEKCDPKGESFQSEFSGFQPNQSAFLRRHESFTWGQLTFGSANQERQDINWRPFLMSERLPSEGTSYPSFQTPLSEVSDTKTSSVPDTETVSSAVDQDNKKLNEQDQPQERELTPSINHASDHDGRDSQSSEDVYSLDIGEFVQKDTNHDEDEISMRKLEIYPIVEAGNAATPVELDRREIRWKSEPIEEEYSSRVVPDVNQEGKTKLEPNSTLLEASGISKQPSGEESELNLMSAELDNSQIRKDVVYDSSPPALEKFLSFATINYEIVSPSASEEETVPFTHEESEMQMDDRAEHIPRNEVDGNISRSKEVVEYGEHDVAKVGPAEVDNRSQDEKTNDGEYFQCEQDKFLTPISGAEVHRDMPKKGDLLVAEQMEDNTLNKEEAPQFEQKEVHSQSHDANVNVTGLHQDLDMKVVSQSSNADAPSEGRYPSELEK